MKKNEDYINGRGAQINPHNRFQKHQLGDSYFETDPEDVSIVKTRFIEVHPKTIVNTVKSTNSALVYSLNPYQGCEHGCVYCYARPSHEYWGYNPGIDFESVILVKQNAPELLEKTLRKKSWIVRPITISGNTDCYQPCERNFELTRQLLAVMLRFKQPVEIITKNALILRDLDLLKKLASLQLVRVHMSITSLNEETRRILEPRTAGVIKKLSVIKQLSENKIPVNVMFAPVIPAINDMEIFSLAKEASNCGAQNLYYQFIFLLGANTTIFPDWLEKNYPDRAEKVINLLKEIYGKKDDKTYFGRKMFGDGNYVKSFQQQVDLARKRYKLIYKQNTLRTDLFEIPESQLRLF